MGKALIINILLVLHGLLLAQTSDTKFSQPLQDVLKMVESRYDVRIDFAEADVRDKMLDYAGWRFRAGVEQTLENILAPFDLRFESRGDGRYRIRPYSYHRWTTEEGKEWLNFLASRYNNMEEWENRKAILKECFLEALGLEDFPLWTDTPPVIVDKRQYNGYTVENVALETLPGIYLFGSVYKPTRIRGKVPVIVSPNGHFPDGRYNKDVQIRCAMLARMGAIVMNYDLFAWGESALQFAPEHHRTSQAMVMQVLNGFRALDYLLSLKGADPARVGITGGSGGGSQTMLLSALDDRYTVSVPAVMLSSYHFGGCPCESGRPVHFCGDGSGNVEISAMMAPKPMLVISDGGDWTAHVPETELPYLKSIYSYYGKPEMVENAHFHEEGHDYGPNKRFAMYRFMAQHLGLKSSEMPDGTWDESACVVEPHEKMYVFSNNVDKLPVGAVRQQLFVQQKDTPRYRVAVCDWMILRRQRINAFDRAVEIGCDGLELDLGSLGNRTTFENKLLDPAQRAEFLEKSRETGIEISSIAMSGFYAQNFAEREGIERIMDDAVNTAVLMGVKTIFLPLGVEGDLLKFPERRPALVERLRLLGQKAEASGVVVGIETHYDAATEVKFLEEIASPAIKSYFNFANAVDYNRDICEELRILGKERIAMIHASGKDSVWLEHDPYIDLPKIKQTLDEMGWSGWLVIERSRDATQPRNVVGNFGANTAYLRKIFQ